MTTRTSRLLAVLLLVGTLGGVGCTTLENAAAKDPRRCERDPTCADKARAADCDTQCANGPDCVDRCREMNAASGATDPR